MAEPKRLICFTWLAMMSGGVIFQPRRQFHPARYLNLLASEVIIQWDQTLAGLNSALRVQMDYTTIFALRLAGPADIHVFFQSSPSLAESWPNWARCDWTLPTCRENHLKRLQPAELLLIKRLACWECF